ncbi:MAG: beta-carotene 15,15'-monooxygenase [Chitinophagaceae bacterium]|nr:MAG: beta-carotene 15,15'-monooxygenase [Chitinophagaceae bacterium]
MINQFRSLNPVNIIILVGFTIFMRLPILLNMPDQLSFEFLEPYARFFIPVPDGASLFSPASSLFFATLIIFAQAMIFNRVVNNHGLLAKPSYLPALLYLTGASLFTQFFFLCPPLICNFLLIWIMDKFLKIGKSANAMMTMFDIGMIIAIGSLIYFPFIVLLIMLWLSLLLYRGFNWREWIAGIIGFLTIFFFLAVFYYWNDNLNQFYKIWKPLVNKFPSVLQINYDDYLVLVPTAVIMILAAFQLRENFFRSFISTRKAFQMLFFMFVVTIISVYTKPGFRVYHFLLSVPPGAVMLAYYFSNAKKRWFYESMFVLLVLSIQYFLFV